MVTTIKSTLKKLPGSKHRKVLWFIRYMQIRRRLRDDILTVFLLIGLITFPIAQWLHLYFWEFAVEAWGIATVAVLFLVWRSRLGVIRQRAHWVGKPKYAGSLGDYAPQRERERERERELKF